MGLVSRQVKYEMGMVSTYEGIWGEWVLGIGM